MPLATLRNQHLELVVSPEAGASIVEFRFRHRESWIPILRPTPEAALAAGNSSEMGSFLLAPYSNRIRGGRFRFRSEAYELRPNTADGHTIHGDVRKRPWHLDSASAIRLKLSFESREFHDFNFPFPIHIDLTYELAENAFTTWVRMTNVGPGPMPAGLGFHPYFCRDLHMPGDRVSLQARVSGVYPELVPTTGTRRLEPQEDFSTLRPVGGADLDHCFAGLAGPVVIQWPEAGVRAVLETDEPLRHLILFTPPGKPYFAVEPVSHANNGFNLLADGIAGHGVVVLKPGAVLAAMFRIRVETD